MDSAAGVSDTSNIKFTPLNLPRTNNMASSDYSKPQALEDILQLTTPKACYFIVYDLHSDKMFDRMYYTTCLDNWTCTYAPTVNQAAAFEEWDDAVDWITATLPKKFKWGIKRVLIVKESRWVPKIYSTNTQ